MKNSKKGFTLIELLVVIAIIGILSAVVLASLSSARSKANDAKVKGQISSIRSAAELYYSDNGNYGTTADACNEGMFANSYLSSLVDTNNYPPSTTVVCGATASAWAVSANLSTSGAHFCADSSGKAASSTSAIAAGATSCP